MTDRVGKLARLAGALLLSLTLVSVGPEQFWHQANQAHGSAEARSRRKATTASRTKRASTRRVGSPGRRSARSGGRGRSYLTSRRSRRGGRVVTARRARAVHVPVVVHESPERVHYRTLLARAYGLRDDGLNEKMAGNFGVALAKLKQSVEVFEEHGGSESNAVKSLLFFDIGQTAELAGELSLARDSYQRCIRVAPPLTSHEAALRLAIVLARMGNLEFARRVGDEAVQAKPNDPRIRAVLAMINDMIGNGQESDRHRELLRSQIGAITVPRLPVRTMTLPPGGGAPDGSGGSAGTSGATTDAPATGSPAGSSNGVTTRPPGSEDIERKESNESKEAKESKESKESKEPPQDRTGDETSAH